MLRALVALSVLTIVSSMKVAIVGSGYAGLATAIKFIDRSFKVTLISRLPINEPSGASAASSGLLHPLTPKGKTIWKGLEGFVATLSLVERAQLKLLDKKVILSNGSCILRPIFYGEEEWLQKADRKELEFISEEECKIRYCVNVDKEKLLGAALYKRSAIIDSSLYLLGMAKILSDSGVCDFVTKSIQFSDIARLSSIYDIVIIAVGAGIKHLWPEHPVKPLNVKYIGGQNFLIPNINGLTVSLLKGEYAVPVNYEEVSYLLCGSTKEFTNAFVDDVFPANMSYAVENLKPKIAPIHPSILSELPTKSFPTGIRVVSGRGNFGRLPIVSRWPMECNPDTIRRDNVWFVTGLGSRGLIHHALLADWVCDASIRNDANYIPKELKLQ